MSAQNPQLPKFSLNLVRIGADPAGEACLHCERGDGEIFLFRNRCQMPEWNGYPLHEACFKPWLEEYEEYEQFRLNEPPGGPTPQDAIQSTQHHKEAMSKRPAWL